MSLQTARRRLPSLRTSAAAFYRYAPQHERRMYVSGSEEAADRIADFFKFYY